MFPVLQAQEIAVAVAVATPPFRRSEGIGRTDKS